MLKKMLFFVLTCTMFYNASATTIDKIILFGDSLSDNGNFFHLTEQGKKIIPFFPLIPRDPPYFHGRFSNGMAWIEVLANDMGLPLINYAYGGSWAETIMDSGPFVPFSLGTQVDYYLVSALSDYHKDKHLYVIWSGANDYIHGRFDANGKPNYEYSTINTTRVIQSQLDWLIYYGARQFLIINLPDLGLTPQIRSLGPEFSRMTSEFINRHNARLATVIKEEQLRHPEVKFVSIDVGNYFSDVILNPEKYHLQNVNDPCYEGGYIYRQSHLSDDPAVVAAQKGKLDIIDNDVLRIAYENGLLAQKGHQPCLNPDEYLFWDRLHPTRVVHQMIAKIAREKLEESNIGW